MEIAARIDDWYRFGADPWTAYDRETLVASDAHGVRGRPRARFEKWQLNNLGFRGPDVGPKQPGRPRIAVMGSSETFGLYEDAGKEWPARLQDLLQGDGVNAEVINAAFYGLGLQRNLSHLEHRILPLEPDVVILYLDPYSGHYLKGEDVAPTPPTEHMQTTSRFAGKIRTLLQGLLPRPMYANYLRRLIERERAVNRLDVHDRIPPHVYDMIRRDLQRFIDLAKQRGARVIMASHISRTDEIALLQRQRDRAALSFDAMLECRAAINSLLADVARENGVAFVDLAGQVPAVPELVADGSHFSNEGARLVAAQFYPAVRRELRAP